MDSIFCTMNYKVVFAFLFTILFAAYTAEATKISFKNLSRHQLQQTLQLGDRGRPKLQVTPEVMAAREEYMAGVKDKIKAFSDFKIALEAAKTPQDFEEVIEDFMTADGRKFSLIVSDSLNYALAESRLKASGELMKNMMIYAANYELKEAEFELECIKKGEVYPYRPMRGLAKLIAFYDANCPFYKKEWFGRLLFIGLIGTVVVTVVVFMIYSIKRCCLSIRKSGTNAEVEA